MVGQWQLLRGFIGVHFASAIVRPEQHLTLERGQGPKVFRDSLHTPPTTARV